MCNHCIKDYYHCINNVLQNSCQFPLVIVYAKVMLCVKINVVGSSKKLLVVQ